MKTCHLIFVAFWLSLTNSLMVSRADDVLCNLCQKLQQKSIDITNQHFEQILTIAEKVCQVKGSPEMCKYFVKGFGKTIMQNKMNFFARTDLICANYLDLCPKKFKTFDLEHFRNKIIEKYPKSDLDAKTTFLGVPFDAITLNDIHIQQDYETNSEIKCNEPEGGCCSAKYGFPKNETHQAGYWASIGGKCDIPPRLFTSTCDFISSNLPAPKFVFLLGDNNAHNYFRTNESEIIESSKLIYDKIRNNFPKSTIIPVLGNHECHFTDFLNFEDQENWTYKNILPLFEPIIGKEKVSDFKKNGFYYIEDQESNVKVISINSQIYDGFNAFNVGQSEFVWPVLEKIAEELYTSEKKNQKVVFLSHISFAEIQNLPEIDEAFRVILERFQTTIIAFFSAHTHFDQIKFIRDQHKKVLLANFISPSLTSDCENPSFRIYKFGNNELQNYEQYSMNLEMHNRKAKHGDFSLTFQKIYDFKNEYKLLNLSKESLQNIYEKFHARDKDVLESYVSHTYCRHNSADFEKMVDELVCHTIDNVAEMITCLEKNTMTGLNSIFGRLVYRRLFLHKMVTKNSSENNR